VGNPTRDGATSRLKDANIDFQSLAASTPYLYINAWTTTLHLRKNCALQWEIVDQNFTFPNEVLVHVTKRTRGTHTENRWKAILLGYKENGFGASDNVRPTFLIVENVGNCFERVGVCSFDIQGRFVANTSNEALIGNIILRREKLTLG
jgi:hypothetical protein